MECNFLNKCINLPLWKLKVFSSGEKEIMYSCEEHLDFLIGVNKDAWIKKVGSREDWYKPLKK